MEKDPNLLSVWELNSIKSVQYFTLQIEYFMLFLQGW